jgi:hypothetical protein
MVYATPQTLELGQTLRGAPNDTENPRTKLSKAACQLDEGSGMKILSVKTDRMYEVRVIDDEGLTMRKFNYAISTRASSGGCIVHRLRGLCGHRSKQQCGSGDPARVYRIVRIKRTSTTTSKSSYNSIPLWW